MIKKYIFLAIAAFSIYGFVTALRQENPGAIIVFLILGIIFSILSWSFVVELVTGKPPKKLGETQSQYEKRLEQRAKDIAERKKWTTIAKNIFEINQTDNRVKLCGCTYDFEDIIDCDLINESSEKIVTQTKGENRKKVSLGKALIGGTLFGAVGAIIGGSAGKTKVNQQSVTTNSPICNKLQIVVTVMNLESPVVYLNFIRRGVYKDSYQYNKAFELATKTLGILRGIIHKNKSLNDIDENSPTL